MEKLTRIGMDISKAVFQLHGVDEAEKAVLKKTLRRAQLVKFFERLPPVRIGIEACGAAHYWARTLRGLGHEVMLLPPQYVKAYVKRGKHDAADAEAVCEAMSRPSMRFVGIKSAEQQSVQMLVQTRAAFVRRRTQLSNSIRGHAAEFGLVAPKGLVKVTDLLQQVGEDERVPVLAKEMFVLLGEQYGELQAQIERVEAKLMAWHRSNEQSKKLAQIPGIGPVGATLITVKAPNLAAFRSGRDFAAWIGLTPKNHSTAGKNRLGVITRAGDEMLRSVLVVGATALIQQVRRGRRCPSPWLAAMLKRKPPKLVAIALANKMARIAFKLLTTGEHYKPMDKAMPA